MADDSLVTLLVAAHPDDEILGAGIWLSRRPAESVHILHVTDGSPVDMHEAGAESGRDRNTPPSGGGSYSKRSNS
jgi:LmbE family N-acetylglucosaminyl deacetylase